MAIVAAPAASDRSITMKVETDLKSGLLLQDAAAAANSAAGSVQNFLSVAGNQATTVTNTFLDKITSAWNCLTA